MPNSASPTTSSHPAEGDMLLQLLKASAQQRDSIQTADMVEDAHLHDPAVAALGPCHTISQYSSHFWPFHASHQSHFQGGLPFPNYAFRPFDSPWSDSFGAWPHASAQRREGLEQINIEGEPVHSSTLQGMKEPSLGASSITRHLNLVTRPAVLSKEMCYSQHTHNERWHPIETHGRIMNVQGVHDAQQDEYKTMAVLRKNKVAEEGDHLHNNSEGLATHSAQATVQADTGWQIAPSSEELEHQDMRDLGSGGTRNERRGRHVRAEYKKKGGNKPFQLQEFAVNRVKEARRALDEVGERVRKVEPQTILRPEVTLQGRTKELSFSKPTDDLKKRRGHMQEWRMKQSQFLGQGRDHCSSVVEQLDYPGLPSNCHVISAPGSALEQSKQSLHDMTSVEQLTAPRKEPWCNYNLDEARGSNQGIREEDEEELLKGIVRILDIDDENAAEESNKDKHTPSTLQIQKAKSDELNQRTIQNNQFNCFGTTPAQTMSRFHRKEVTHRSDIEKLSNELLHLFKSLIAQEEEEIRRKLLLSNLEKIILQSWPQAQLFLFGSCANSFGVCNSDIDVCLSVPDEKSSKPELVMKLADVLRTNEMQHVQALTHARVPIVKFTHPETGLSCDICVNNMLAVVNTKLLHDYAQIDHRLRQLAFIVKHWAKQRQVNETYRGTLSSYAYVLMCIYFLQLRRPAILPCLQEMEPTYDVTISDVHCAYYDQVEKLLNFGKKNKETLGELVISFFDYWAFRHDYRHSVISVRTGSVLSKIEKDWTRRIGNERHLICIEDPFEISHDLGRVVDKHSICILRDEFQRAARILHHHSNPCVTLFEPYICGKN